mmetsp:Transcript_20525/g.38172  ORF Transcript_20525/g.38172 Transcript_20525/m.38172 type:complete len:849 (+) Transcript_20525:165-2711(+)
MRVFIEGVDGYVGAAVKRLLLADAAKKAEENEGEVEEDDKLVIVGSVQPGVEFKPKGVQEIIQRGDLDKVSELARTADAIVLDTHSSVKEASTIVKSLKQPFEGTKSLVLLSTLLTWDSTPAPRVVEDEEKGEDEDQEESDGKPVVPTFSETDFTRRKPSPSFLLHKTLESQVLALSHDSLSTTVLASGLIYGAEEGIFHSFFRDAWLGRQPLLPAINENCNNVVPMVHVNDLARAACTSLADPPTQQYVVVADESRSSVSEVVSAIFSVLQPHSELALQEVPVNPNSEDAEEDDERVHAWKQFKSNITFADVSATDEILLKDPSWMYLQANLAFDTSEGSVMSLVEEWKSREGLVQNVKAVVEEFKASRDLRPIRLALSGPPCSGKTTVARRVADEYSLPIVSAPSALEFLLRLLEDTRKERAERLVVLRESRLAEREARAAQRAEEAKLSENEEEPTEEEEVNEEEDPAFVELNRKSIAERLAERAEMCIQAKGRLSNRLEEKVLRARLLQPDCLNHGYILDAEPYTYAGLVRLFGITVITEGLGGEPSEAGEDIGQADFEDYKDDEEIQGEGKQEEGAETTDTEAEVVVDPRLAPTAIVVVDAAKETLHSRACANTSDGARTETEFEEALQLYQMRNADHLFHTPLSFFEGASKLESMYLPTDKQDQLKFSESKCDESKEGQDVVPETKEVEDFAADAKESEETELLHPETFDSLTMYIEQGGRPFNYHPTDEEILEMELRNKAAVQKQEAAERRRRVEFDQKRKEEEAERLKAMEEHRDQVARHEAELLEARSEPLRAYLLKHVMPTLSEGLVETCRVKPDDPIDFLAEYLFRNSAESETMYQV